MEYSDHVRTARTWESRLNRTMLRQEPLKARALTLAREVADTEITKTALNAMRDADAKRVVHKKGGTTLAGDPEKADQN